MKFTSEDLMKAMGLSIGDRVKVTMEFYDGIIKTGLYEIDKYNRLKCLPNQQKTDLIEFDGRGIETLMGYGVEYEILPKPKRVGDLKCDGKCLLCPCIYVCNDEINAVNKTLYEILELGIATFTKTPQKMNKEIHDVIKARLDKEVE